MVEPTICPGASLILERAATCIGVEALTLSITAFSAARDAAPFSELFADAGVVEPAFVRSVASSPCVISAQIPLCFVLVRRSFFVVRSSVSHNLGH